MDTNILFKQILENNKYFIKVYSHLKETDFTVVEERAIFNGIGDLFGKYKHSCNIDELRLYFDTTAKINVKLKHSVIEKLDSIKNTELKEINFDLLIQSTENFIKDVRWTALTERSIKLLEGIPERGDSKEKIMEEQKEVLQLSFTGSLGHDYIEDCKERFQEYGNIDNSLISSGIELIDKAGGGKPKSLTVFLAPSNVGKSMHMSSWASKALMDGKNVAIFSMEDGEFAYGSRIDCNIMNKPLEELKETGNALSTTFDSIVSGGVGKLKIKEYPSGSATINHFKSVLQDWKLKDEFIPDIIFVDYINIMTSVRGTSNGYESGKFVSEELRSLAMEIGIPVVSATQARRDVFKADNLGMADTADSLGIPQTADCMIGIVENDDTPDLHILSILKSRQIDKNNLRACAVNISKKYQRVWNVDGKGYNITRADEKAVQNMNTFVETSDMVGNNSNDYQNSFFKEHCSF